MIVFAAFTPHSPLLMPAVGKEAREHMVATIDAMRELSRRFQESRPDTVVCISSHAITHESAFSASVGESYHADLSAFGDLATADAYGPDLALVDAIQRAARRAGIPFTLDTAPVLEYGASVPLHLLARGNHRPRIVPLNYGGLDRKDQLAFGRLVRDVIESRTQRVAILASGDLAHTLSTDAPGGFHPNGKAFDDAVRQACADHSLTRLLSIKDQVVVDSAECAWRSLLLLFGILEHMSVRSEILSYEHPFGVGYLTVQFHVE